MWQSTFLLLVVRKCELYRRKKVWRHLVCVRKRDRGKSKIYNSTAIQPGFTLLCSPPSAHWLCHITRGCQIYNGRAPTLSLGPECRESLSCLRVICWCGGHFNCMEEVKKTLIWVFQNFSICLKTRKIYSVHINLPTHSFTHLDWYILESLGKTFRKMFHSTCSYPLTEAVCVKYLP